MTFPSHIFFFQKNLHWSIKILASSTPYVFRWLVVVIYKSFSFSEFVFQRLPLPLIMEFRVMFTIALLLDIDLHIILFFSFHGNATRSFIYSCLDLTNGLQYIVKNKK